MRMLGLRGVQVWWHRWWRPGVLLLLLVGSIVVAGVTLPLRLAVRSEVPLGSPSGIGPEQALVHAPAPRFVKGELAIFDGEWHGKVTTNLAHNLTPGAYPRGLRVSPGERVVIWSARVVRGEWVYYVRTAVGEEGWVSEGVLKKLPI